jgi:hypothetical protein
MEILHLPCSWPRRLANIPYLPSSQLSTNCPHGTSEFDWLFSTELFFIIPSHGPNSKHRSQQFLYCCLRIRCRGNLFTETLPSSGCLLWLHYSGLQASCHSIIRCCPVFMTALHKRIYLLSTSLFWYPQMDLCGAVSASETLCSCKYTVLVPYCVSTHNQSSNSSFSEHNTPLPDSQVVATDLGWASWIQSTLIHPVSLRSILILSSNTHPVFQVASSFQFVVPTFWVHFSSLPQICDESELQVTIADLPLALSTLYLYVP